MHAQGFLNQQSDLQTDLIYHQYDSQYPLYSTSTNLTFAGSKRFLFNSSIPDSGGSNTEYGSYPIIAYIDFTIQSVASVYTIYKLASKYSSGQLKPYDVLKTLTLFGFVVASKTLEIIVDNGLFSKALTAFFEGAFRLGVYHNLSIKSDGKFLHKEPRGSAFNELEKQVKIAKDEAFKNSGPSVYNQDEIDFIKTKKDIMTPKNQNAYIIYMHSEPNPSNAKNSNVKDQNAFKDVKSKKIEFKQIQPKNIDFTSAIKDMTEDSASGAMENSHENSPYNTPKAAPSIFKQQQNHNRQIKPKEESILNLFKLGMKKQVKEEISKELFKDKLKEIGEEGMKHIVNQVASIGFIGATIPNMANFIIEQIHYAGEVQESDSSYFAFVNNLLIRSTLVFSAMFIAPHINKVEQISFCTIGAVSNTVGYIMTANPDNNMGWIEGLFQLIAQPIAGCLEYQILLAPQYLEGNTYAGWVFAGGISNMFTVLIEEAMRGGGRLLAKEVYGSGAYYMQHNEGGNYISVNEIELFNSTSSNDTILEPSAEMVVRYSETILQNIAITGSFYILRRNMVKYNEFVPNQENSIGLREIDKKDLLISGIIFVTLVGTKIATHFISSNIGENVLNNFLQGALSSSIYKTTKPYADFDPLAINTGKAIELKDAIDKNRASNIKVAVDKVFNIKEDAIRKFTLKTIAIGFVGQAVAGMSNSVLEGIYENSQEGFYSQYTDTTSILISTTLMYAIFFWGVHFSETTDYCMWGALANTFGYILNAPNISEEGYIAFLFDLASQPIQGCLQYAIIRLPDLLEKIEFVKKHLDPQSHVSWVIIGGLSQAVVGLIADGTKILGEYVSELVYEDDAYHIANSIDQSEEIEEEEKEEEENLDYGEDQEEQNSGRHITDDIDSGDVIGNATGDS